MVLAAHGVRDLDDGAKPIEDDGERIALRDQARGVYRRSLLLAVLGTSLIVVLPL